MRAIQAIKSSSSLFPPIVNKFKPHDSPTRNNKDSQQYHHPIKDRERDLSLPPIKNSQMNNATQSSLKKYKKIKYLGKGSYGAALLVCLRNNPTQKFVIKEIVIGHLKPAAQQAAKIEADVLHQMAHSNITMYIESFVENAKLYIVMEFADGGDLCGAVARRRESGKKWDEAEVMRIFVQICLALKHVHEANILHRDLKSQNIFLTLKGVVKLGDFGIAKMLDASADQANTTIGTPYYLSPEICESLPYGQKSDVWSLGVVLFELCALELPFQAKSLPSLVQKICHSEPPYAKIESHFSHSLVALMKQLLTKSADDRPSVKEILRTSYVKSHICQLLSHTLVTHSGGGEVALALRRSQSGSLLPPRTRTPLHLPNTPVNETRIQSEHVVPSVDTDSNGFVNKPVHDQQKQQQQQQQQKGYSEDDSPGKLEDEYLRLLELEKQSDIRRELARQESARELQRKAAREEAEKAEIRRKDNLRRFKLEMLRKKESEKALFTDGVIIVDSESPVHTRCPVVINNDNTIRNLPVKPKNSLIRPTVDSQNQRDLPDTSTEDQVQSNGQYCQANNHMQKLECDEEDLTKPQVASTPVDISDSVHIEQSVDSAVNTENFAQSNPKSVDDLGTTANNLRSTLVSNQSEIEHTTVVMSAAKYNNRHNRDQATDLNFESEHPSDTEKQTPNDEINSQSSVRCRDMSPQSRVIQLRLERDRRKDDARAERERQLNAAMNSNIQARLSLDRRRANQVGDETSPQKNRIDASLSTPARVVRRAISFTIDLDDNESSSVRELSSINRSPPKRPLPSSSIKAAHSSSNSNCNSKLSGSMSHNKVLQQVRSAEPASKSNIRVNQEDDRIEKSGWKHPTDLSGIMTHIQYHTLKPPSTENKPISNSDSNSYDVKLQLADNPFAQLIDDNTDLPHMESNEDVQELVLTLRARSEKQRLAHQAAAEAFQARRAKRLQLLHSKSSPVITTEIPSINSETSVSSPTEKKEVSSSIEMKPSVSKDGVISRNGSQSSISSAVNSKRLADVLGAVASAVQVVNQAVEGRLSPLARPASNSFITNVSSGNSNELLLLNEPICVRGMVAAELGIEDKENEKEESDTQNTIGKSETDSGSDILEKTLNLWFNQSSHSFNKASVQVSAATSVQKSTQKSDHVKVTSISQDRRPIQANRVSKPTATPSKSPTVRSSRSPIRGTGPTTSATASISSATRGKAITSSHTYTKDGRRVLATNIKSSHISDVVSLSKIVEESTDTTPIVIVEHNVERDNDIDNDDDIEETQDEPVGDISTLQCLLASELMSQDLNSSPYTL